MTDGGVANNAGRGEHEFVSSNGGPGEPADVLKAERRTIDTRRGLVGRRPDAPLTGLALSGGGIRSASFGLGVLQALQTDGAIEGIDYLSTVSGGGYIGSCMTACMQAKDNTTGVGIFPFLAPGRYDDTAAVRHVRDFSNYLIPRGGWDVVSAAGLILRGLVANAVLAAPFVLLPAFLLALLYPTAASLKGPGPADFIPTLPVPGFPLTVDLMVVAGGLLLLWAVAKSLATAGFKSFKQSSLLSSELHGPFADIWKGLFAVIAVTAVIELQPLALRLIEQPVAPAGCVADASVVACAGKALSGWLKVLTPALAPFGAIASFLAQRLSSARQTDGGGRPAGLIRKTLATVPLVLAAIVIPSLLWLLCLELADWAQIHNARWGLLCAFGVALVLAACIDPNATSLHRMYRDRLAKAFLFRMDAQRDDHGDLKEHAPKMHEVDAKLCPYPIVNASLNIEGSPYANKRGRNADFFVFTPEYTGSEATGYVGSAKMSKWEPKLDLGTAMAISGAAVSPNMGAATIKSLVPTLALLNVRLGYWIASPKSASGKAPTGFKAAYRRFRRSFLLIDEVLGRIKESSPTVYLTDGGNLENLGVYSLMARQCGLIIAVDAEADPGMGFGSLLKLERFARSDLGAIIELPWQGIAARSLAVNESFAKDALLKTDGFHAAACKIHYGDNRTGVLLYIKSSLTGDEDDYVLDYKRRYPTFPHETTSDQFFGEEQLEAYRALGFHAARGLIAGTTPFAVLPENGRNEEQTRSDLLSHIRASLLPPTAGSAAQQPVASGQPIVGGSAPA